MLMCLNLKENTDCIIADKDIICYKWLVKREVFDIDISQKGKDFTGIIDNNECSGKIQIEDTKVYFCTDLEKLDGSNCEDKLGYKYSWVLDNWVETLTIAGEKIQKVTHLFTPYQDVRIEIGNTYTSELINKNNLVSIGLHSFAYLEGAELDSMNSSKKVEVKCIIPKGARYYKGSFNGSVSYASNKLEYVKIVK